MYIFVINHESDEEPIFDASYHGPFESAEDAQKYAQAWRREHNLPHDNINPTAEENELWADEGWTFAIFELNDRRHSHA